MTGALLEKSVGDRHDSSLSGFLYSPSSEEHRALLRIEGDQQELFIPYYDAHLSDRERFDACLRLLDVEPEKRELLERLLEPLSDHEQFYRQVLRTAVLSKDIAAFFHLDRRKAVFMAVMRLIDQFDLDQREVLIEDTAVSLAGVVELAVTFDRLHHLPQGAVIDSQLNRDIKEELSAAFPGGQKVIEQLFASGVLTDAVRNVREQPGFTPQDRFQLSSYKFEPLRRSPEQTARFVQLACALEPLTEKPNCTTRYGDVKRRSRLSYFIAGGINLGDSFKALATAIDQTGMLPERLYRFGIRAQLESKRNRGGGRINEGIIELLVPIVAAQHHFDPNCTLSCDEILDHAKALVESSNQNDVADLIRLKKLSLAMSAKDRPVPHYSEAKTILEYYQVDRDHATRVNGLAFNEEWLSGFQTIREMVRCLSNSTYPSFAKRVEDAYLRGALINPDGTGGGVLADFIAVAMYLYASQNPREQVFS